MSAEASFRGNSAARLAVDAAGLAFGAVGAVITTRVLGPSGQGVFAVLFFLSAVMITLAGLGLGDAAVVWVGQGRAEYRTAAGATLAASMLSGGIALLPTIGVGAVLIRPTSATLWLAVIATAVDVPFSVLALSCGSLLNVDQRVRASSAVAFTLSAVTLVGLVLFVIWARLSVFGAVLAGVVASDLALLNALWLLRRAGLIVRPSWNRSYLRSVIGFSSRLQSVSLLTIASGRVDLILVFTLASRASAGRYSVPLTIGSVATLVPYAVSYAAFPRLANLSGGEAAALTAKIFRSGIVLAFVTAVALVAASPIAIPSLLGTRYSGSVVPAQILAVGGVFISGQWMLARAAAARGDASVLLRSFAISLASMVLLDIPIIPAFGIVGAAAVSSLSSLAAFVYCVGAFHRGGTPTRFLLPRSGTMRDLAAVIRRPSPTRFRRTAQASPRRSACDSAPSEANPE